MADGEPAKAGLAMRLSLCHPVPTFLIDPFRAAFLLPCLPRAARNFARHAASFGALALGYVGAALSARPEREPITAIARDNVLAGRHRTARCLRLILGPRAAPGLRWTCRFAAHGLGTQGDA